MTRGTADEWLDKKLVSVSRSSIGSPIALGSKPVFINAYVNFSLQAIVYSGRQVLTVTYYYTTIAITTIIITQHFYKILDAQYEKCIE